MSVKDLIVKLQSLKTKDEARKLLIELTNEDPNSWSNIKYVTGYLGNDERQRILNLFL